MASRVIYGLADRGSLPSVLGRINPATRTPLVATILVTTLVLVLALAFPLDRLAETTSVITLIVFTLVNLALIAMKMRGLTVPEGTWQVPIWVPITGAITCLAFLIRTLLGAIA